MDKYKKRVLVIATIFPLIATITGIIFPIHIELIPVSTFIIAMVGVFYMGMIIGIKNGEDKK